MDNKKSDFQTLEKLKGYWPKPTNIMLIKPVFSETSETNQNQLS